MWTKASPAQAFDQRRKRLAERIRTAALVAAGQSRPRNFQHNRFPFRADSHFLYLVGRSLENAALLIDGDRATLFTPPPDPEAELWSGAMPALDTLSKELGLEVLPLSELRVPEGTAALPTQDTDSALWLSELLDRDLPPGSGSELDGADAALADAMIELRLCHDDAAIEQLRQAAAGTERAHRAGMQHTRPGE